MREETAKWLRLYTLKEPETDNEHETGIVPWARASQDTKDYWLKGAGELHALISEGIKKQLLTDIGCKDSEQAEADLARHKFPTLFSYRQAYFVGCQAQLQKILKALEVT